MSLLSPGFCLLPSIFKAKYDVLSSFLQEFLAFFGWKICLLNLLNSLFPLFFVLVFAEFSFTCIIDLTSALEYDGIISGFMEFYRRTVGFTNALTSCLFPVVNVWMDWKEAFTCVLGGTLSGNSLRHHDVLLGRNSTLDHVPGDDQQDNRQVGNLFCSPSHKNLKPPRGD